jgi:hypothetical protein
MSNFILETQCSQHPGGGLASKWQMLNARRRRRIRSTLSGMTVKLTRYLIVIALVAFANAGSLIGQATAGCPAAPRSRLHAGMTAVVAPGIGPLNLRALPAVGTGIRAQLYGGHRLTVLSGPSCNSGYAWWRVETRAGVRGWIAEGTWLRYWVIPARDSESGHTPAPLDFTCPPERSSPCYTLD